MEGGGTRRKSAGQLRGTIERQDRSFRQRALRDHFSTTRQIADPWFEEQSRSISMHSCI